MQQIIEKLIAVLASLTIVLTGISGELKPQTFGNFSPTGGGTYRLQTSLGTTNTSIKLSSFKEPVSNIKYTMTYLNSSILYGTLDPQTSYSEFVSASGITQNADGTATLTGVTRGLSRTPGTGGCVASTTLAQTHAGQSIFILSNAPCMYYEYARSQTNESITGLWNFTQLPTSGVTATTSTQLVTKNYADNVALQGAATSTETQAGICELATQAEMAAGTVWGANDPHCIQSQYASSTPLVATTILPITGSDGKLNANFIATTSAYSWTGQNTFSTATTTFNATTSIAATANNPIRLNSVNYTMPSAQGTSTTVLMNDGNGTLYWDGTAKRVYTTITPVTVVSSVSTTTLVTFTLPANFLGTQNILRVVLNVSAFRIDATGRGAVFNFIYGATTQTTNVYAAGDTGIQSGDIIFELMGAGATSSQKGEFHLSTQLNGISDAITTATGASIISTGTYAIDSTVAQTLTLQIQFTFSGANNNITMDNAYAYIIR